MRTIKFRGKRIDNGEWVEGTFIQPYSNECYFLESASHIDVSDIDLGTVFIKVHPETVGQFTGLTDKDGKEIWEGDAVERQFGVSKVVFYNEEKAGFYVKFFEGGGFVDPLEYFTERNCKVIGNIHDNKEENEK